MNLIISFKSELLKTRRSAVWLSTIVMAAFVPLFLLLVFKQAHDGNISDVVPKMQKDAWNEYFYQGRGMISFVFFPLFIILMSKLLPQIEYRNHTWKQVMASPQSFGRIYFTKFLVLQLFILLFIFVHCLFMGISAKVSDLNNPLFQFSKNHLDWTLLIKNLIKTYLSVLALSAFQFWLGIRFKSFLVPVGVGLLCSILGLVNMLGYDVVDAKKYFFNYPAFIFMKANLANVYYALWGSIVYAAVFFALGFWDFSKRGPR